MIENLHQSGLASGFIDDRAIRHCYWGCNSHTSFSFAAL